ncbi:MAG: purine-nucleoside phosphorylase [Limisphaerales bacterium]|jgi:purine-nucleoside phosphorylase
MKILEQIKEAQEYILARSDFKPEFGIILGTGLGGLVEKIEIEIEIPYQDIPHFPVSTVESHSGKLLLGKLQGKNVVAMHGRFHYYEGYSMQQVVFPVRVMKWLGISRLFVSNASGSLQRHINAGDLMVIADHINLQPESPFRGQHYPEFGPRFPDPLHTYDQKMNDRALQMAEEESINCHKGVYVSVPGPQLETPAEYDFLHRIGGDAVGMSTVPEALAASQMGIPVFAISVITDKGYPPEEVKGVTIEEVIAIAAKAEPKMTKLLARLIAETE